MNEKGTLQGVDERNQHGSDVFRRYRLDQTNVTVIVACVEAGGRVATDFTDQN
jgi:hypothetical protein